MDLTQSLALLFKSRGSGPFLFVGSGFSRRYLGLEDWRGLLSRFCITGRPFEFYLSNADGRYPAAAKLLAADFNEHWWNSSDYEANVERFKSKITDQTSALRIEICNYLTTLDQARAKTSPYAHEVELLAGLNVDGVITTNWDLFLEQVFPDYRVYIGQKELLFSNPQEIGEIYKIHGCSTQPHSLVLTSRDYEDFDQQNAYLAAKLITIFVEHPIVFLGYSISDENICSLLRAISLCIGKENIDKLRRNLIFVQRPKNDESLGISDTYLTIDGVQIPLVLVRTNEFAAIYEAINLTKRKIPARVLRFCKEQLYELVRSSDPDKKLCVVDIDEIDKKEDVEFLVGVGVASEHEGQIHNLGYATIETEDLFADLLHEDRHFNAAQILEHVLKNAGRNTKFVPVFKYLQECGIDTEKKYKESGILLNKWVERDIKQFRTKGYSLAFFRSYRKLPRQVDS